MNEKSNGTLFLATRKMKSKLFEFNSATVVLETIKPVALSESQFAPNFQQDEETNGEIISIEMAIQLPN